jgi:hypothetical protein
MGLPFVVGNDHVIVTISAEFADVTDVGGSGMKAQSRVILLENVL